MGIAYNTSIVRDGIRCLIDIANPKCLKATSNQAIDLSGRGNHGILRNQDGTQTSLDSMPGVLEYDVNDTNVPVLNFVGYGGSAQGYLEFSNHPCAGDTSYSVDAWFKIINLAPSSNYNVIFYSTHDGVGDQEFGLMAQNTTSDPDVAIEINNAYTAGSSGIRASVGWHHFVLTFNGSTSVVYIDGVNVYSRSDSQDQALESSGWNWIGVGQWSNGSYGGQYGYTQGKLGALSLYGKALTASEIQQNFEALRGRYGI